MLASIAWKNVWRNKRRSAIMITAIALGLWGGLFAVGIFTGMYDALVNSAIDRDLTHIQLHAKGFRDERAISMFIPGADSVAATLQQIPGVYSISARTIIEGMGSSATSSQGVKIVGIDPPAERNSTAIARRLVQGKFFEGSERSPILIGRKLAEKLDLRLRGKIVLSFQRPDGAIVYGAFRITGIFDTESSTFDGATVFLRRPDLDGLMGEVLIHEIALRLTTNDSLDGVAARAAALYPGLQVETWKEIAPELKLTAESSDVSMTIFLGIILLALLFGITNTMLMSVLDRVKEFGVLIAIGMKRRKIFTMIFLETLFLSITGSAVGVALGAGTIAWFSQTGIYLGLFSDGLSKYGISSMLYPIVHSSIYPSLGLMVVFAACISAIYPALKAIRLNPASAIATFG
jgi:ABC-type lipoprotein release transport system permease subunit